MESLRHRCLGCGGSCQGVAVTPADPSERARIDAHAALLGIDRPWDGARLRLNAGRCVFLDATGCRLHAALGAEAKPAMCRQFPLVALRVDGTLRRGIDPACYTWHTTRDGPPLGLPELVAAHDDVTDLPPPPASLRALSVQLGVAGRVQAVEAWQTLPIVALTEPIQTAPMLRDALRRVARASADWSPPPPWPPDDNVALEALRRVLWLQLLPGYSPDEVARLALVGSLGALWAGAPAGPLAAWWRAARSPEFADAVLSRVG